LAYHMGTKEDRPISPSGGGDKQKRINLGVGFGPLWPTEIKKLKKKKKEGKHNSSSKSRNQSGKERNPELHRNLVRRQERDNVRPWTTKGGLLKISSLKKTTNY